MAPRGPFFYGFYQPVIIKHVCLITTQRDANTPN